MTMNAPLAVRFKTSYTDSLLIDEVDSPRITNTCPGGFGTFECNLRRPLRYQPGEIDVYSRVTVYDRETGDVVFDGRMEDPGATGNSTGELWNIAALGGQSFMTDIHDPVIYVTKDMSHFYRFGGSRPGGTVSNDEGPSGETGLKVMAGGSGSWSSPQYIGARNSDFSRAFTNIARFSVKSLSGAFSSNWQQRVYGIPSEDLIISADMQTFAQTFTGLIGGIDFDAGDNQLDIRQERTGIAATTDENAWTLFYDYIARGTIMHEWGDFYSSGEYTNDFVYPHEVFADILARYLADHVDGADAYIDESSTYEIDNFSFPMGATAKEIVGKLYQLVPTHYWAIWERKRLTDKFSAEYRPWPTNIRYEADVSGGVDQSGGPVDMFNSVLVDWEDNLGRPKITRVNSTVDELTRAGIDRTTRIKLDSRSSSSANASQAGTAFLEEHNIPSVSGTVKIDRPIVDFQTGRSIKPHLIRSGNLIRLRGLRPRVKALRSQVRDGTSVFRIAKASYDDRSASATLDLDWYAPTTYRMIANLLDAS
jgi:hypothetical protein